MLDEYGYGDLKGKQVTIVGQSNLLGKPLALAVFRRGGTVYSCNASTPDSAVMQACLASDIIISCTGVVHRLDERYVRDDQTQVVIDVGR